MLKVKQASSSRPPHTPSPAHPPPPLPHQRPRCRLSRDVSELCLPQLLKLQSIPTGLPDSSCQRPASFQREQERRQERQRRVSWRAGDTSKTAYTCKIHANTQTCRQTLKLGICLDVHTVAVAWTRSGKKPPRLWMQSSGSETAVEPFVSSRALASPQTQALVTIGKRAAGCGHLQVKQKGKSKMRYAALVLLFPHPFAHAMRQLRLPPPNYILCFPIAFAVEGKASGRSRTLASKQRMRMALITKVQAVL